MSKELTSKDFDEFLKNENVIVDYWASWCRPCLLLAPIFEELANEFKNISFGKLNIEDNEARMISSIPTLIFFKNGKEVYRHEGLTNKNTLKDIINRIFK